MNAAMRAFVRFTVTHGFKVLGIQDGFSGLLQDQVSGFIPAEQQMFAYHIVFHVFYFLLSTCTYSPFSSLGLSRVILITVSIQSFDCSRLADCIVKLCAISSSCGHDVNHINAMINIRSLRLIKRLLTSLLSDWFILFHSISCWSFLHRQLTLRLARVNWNPWNWNRKSNN